MKDFSTLGGLEIAGKLREGALRKEEVYEFFHDRARRLQPKLNAFVDIFAYEEQKEAKGICAGVPLAVKDNICIKGKSATCGSKILKGHTAVYDATVVTKVKEAGIVLLGTANMDEFAFGSSCENSCYGPTKNPWNLERVPGGSSGGSAASVAARCVPFALGSDTGGSIRQPASLCGVVGFKPTYGRVSRFGLVAFGSSLDQIGPLTTNFVDCAHLLSVICGHDPNDSTSSRMKTEDFSPYLVDDVSGLTIGIPREYFSEGLDRHVLEAVTRVRSFFEKRGAKVKDISLPHTEYAVSTYYIVATAEASSNLERFDGIKYGLRVAADNLGDIYTKTRGEGFGMEAKRRIFLGTYSLSSGYYDAYYGRALRVRTLIKEDFIKAFGEVDVILTPTSPTCAFKIGERTEDPLSMYLSDIFTISANLAGLPAVSFPCGFSKDNLPIGAQLIGKPFDEKTLIRTGFCYQEHNDYHQRIPEEV